MSVPDPLTEIRRLYFSATKATIGRDFDRAIDLLKTLPDDDTRSRAAVFMDGLAEMRKDWGAAREAAPATAPPARKAPRPGGSRRRVLKGRP